MNNLNVAKVFDIEIYSEICCDLCNEVIHNHIDCCPICKTKYAPTTAYHNLQEFEDKVITCEQCNSTFELLSDNWYWEEITTVKLVSKQ